MRGLAAGLAATVLIGTVAASGCGVGPGEASAGSASLRVTREFGATELVDATLDGPRPSDTVVRFLDVNADVETSYGGNFVDSIDGVAGSTSGGGSEDWFFFVNGIYSEIGAGEATVHPGDRIWWDYRRWQDAYRVPAVVGSWPEPFVHGTGEGPVGVVVECVAGTEAQVCGDVVDRLGAGGVDAALEQVPAPVPHPDELRLLVGAWGDLRSDSAASQLEDGPSTSGVYAKLAPCDVGYRLEILGSDARPREQLTSAGFVAAVRRGDDEPTWLISATTGGDELQAAVDSLDTASLRDRYAVARVPDDEATSIPAADDLPIDDQAACG